MPLLDLRNKHIHFIGIGGIGMSGLAQLLHERGYSVSGSDISWNANLERLENLEIPVVLGHEPSNLNGKDIVIVSTGIKNDNSELREASTRSLPILHRAELLGLIMGEKKGIAISGTHGKTTSTALAGWVLEKANFDPTVITGGIMNAWNSNVKDGKGDLCIAEADESDGSFLNLSRQFTLTTNIEPEHMDHYNSLEVLLQAFEAFVSEGKSILGIDSPNAYSLWKKLKNTHPCIAYGLHEEADIRAKDISLTPQGSLFTLVKNDLTLPLSLSLRGQHNIVNALGVAALAFECGVKESVLAEAFSTFPGVQRRFTVVGEWQGITIVDDYAHHPTEIRATLSAAKETSPGRVIAVLEPHKYTRVAHHFHDFAACCEEADLTIVLPIYSAREAPLDGITHHSLAAAMKGKVYCCDDPETLPSLIQEVARTGDTLMCLGAGSISSLARALPSHLNRSLEQVYV